MAMMRCPQCQADIRKPTSPWAVIFGIVAFLSVGSLALIFLCVAAIVAVGANAAAEMERKGAVMQIDAIDELGGNVPVIVNDLG